MLKDLALIGFQHIHVIDMDTIDISNLNRQFLFREKDVGKPKATTAAAFIQARIPSVTVTAHVGRIQDFGRDFYAQFDIVVCGLDNMDARRWINSLLVSLVDRADIGTIKPLIDGGTEGFGGQVKVVIPTITSCIECQMDMYATRPQIPLCTVTSIPRQPEHCIEWAHLIAWPKSHPETTFDADNPDHLSWIHTTAQQRADEFSITGLDYSLVMGVIKNIVPAIASTNAIVAAACASEAFKISSGINPCLGSLEDEDSATYMMYTADSTTYSYTFRPDKKPDCPVCGITPRLINCSPSQSLSNLIDQITNPLPSTSDSHIIRPVRISSLTTATASIYFAPPHPLHAQTTSNLSLPLSDLFADADELAVTDVDTRKTFKFKIHFGFPNTPIHR